jgi:hypothetical protein
VIGVAPLTQVKLLAISTQRIPILSLAWETILTQVLQHAGLMQ